MALTIGELTGYIDLDDSGAQAGVQRTEQAMQGLQRGTDGRLRDMRGRFIAEGAAMGAALGEGVSGGADQVSAALRRVEESADGAGRGMAGIGAATRVAKTSTLALSAASLVAAGSLAAVPLAVIGMGAAVLKENEQVKGAFTDLKEHVKGQMQELAEPLVKPFTDAAGRLGGIFDDLAPQLGQLFENVAPMIDPLVEGIGNLAEGVMPGLVAATEAAQPVVEALSKGLGSLGEGIGGFFEGVSGGADGAATGLDALFGAVGEILPALGELIGALAEAGGPVLAALAKALTPVITKLADALGPALAELGPPLAELATSLGEALVPIVEALAPVLGTVAEAFAAFLPSITPLLPMFGQLVADLLPALMPLLDALVNVFTALSPVIAALIPILTPILALVAKLAALFAENLAAAINDVIVPALNAIAALLRGDFSAAWGHIKEMVSGIVRTLVRNFIEMPGKLWDATADLRAKLWGRMQEAGASMVEAARKKIASVVSWMKGLPGRIVSAVGDLGSLLYDKGADIARGLLRGIKSMGRWIASQLKSWAASVVPGPVAKALGIHSPSRVMAREVGRWIPPGIVQGIRGAQGQLDSTMRSLVTPPPVPRFALAGTPAGAFGGAPEWGAQAPGGPMVHVEHWHAAENGTPDDNARALAWAAKARG